LSEGWCKCGIALEDPLHYGFHQIIAWNAGVMQDARIKAQKEFEKRLPKTDKKKEKQWTSLDI
jgi:hypothetical protein